MFKFLVRVVRFSNVSQKVNKQVNLQTLIEKKTLHLSTMQAQKKPAQDDKTKPKNTSGIKITLVGNDNAISITSLAEAEKLANRRALKLIKLSDLDTKTQRPIYKLLSPAEFLESEVGGKTLNKDEKGAKKTEKLLTIGHRIADHDLSSRIKNIGKWLSKGSEIRVVIQCGSDDTQNGEKVFDKLEQFVKSENTGKIVQKRVKNGNVRFSIVPIKNDKES